MNKIWLLFKICEKWNFFIEGSWHIIIINLNRNNETNWIHWIRTKPNTMDGLMFHVPRHKISTCNTELYTRRQIATITRQTIQIKIVHYSPHKWNSNWILFCFIFQCSVFSLRHWIPCETAEYLIDISYGWVWVHRVFYVLLWQRQKCLIWAWHCPSFRC